VWWLAALSYTAFVRSRVGVVCPVREYDEWQCSGKPRATRYRDRQTDHGYRFTRHLSIACVCVGISRSKIVDQIYTCGRHWMARASLSRWVVGHRNFGGPFQWVTSDCRRNSQGQAHSETYLYVPFFLRGQISLAFAVIEYCMFNSEMHVMRCHYRHTVADRQVIWR